MSVVVASERALADLRRQPDFRRHVLARAHPDGGVWLSPRTPQGERWVQDLSEKYGTRAWTRRGWITRRTQLRLPGF